MPNVTDGEKSNLSQNSKPIASGILCQQSTTEQLRPGILNDSNKSVNGVTLTQICVFFNHCDYIYILGV